MPTEEYVSALRREIEVRFPRASSTPVQTFYLGGGTPSRLGPGGVASVLRLISDRFTPVLDAEVTLEANPDDVSRAAVDEWRAAGVNRVSLGVQSFDERALRWMHRAHDADRVEAAAAMLRAGGIDNWSLDLIFALPTELERDWRSDLDRAVALGPTHISLYGLTVESRTPLARWRDRGAAVEAGEDDYAREYLVADATLAAAGYEHYEVSNFGRPKRLSRHNRGYWTGAPYVGFGPAAHGFDGDVRRWNRREYAAWLRTLREGADPVEGCETLTEENRVAERVYLALRTSDGLILEPSELDVATSWVREGWGNLYGDRLRLTAAGWLRLDALAARLTAHRSH